MSQTYIGILISLLAPWLPKLGIVIGNDALTTTITTILAIGGAIWAMYRRHQAGGVNIIGLRK